MEFEEFTESQKYEIDAAWIEHRGRQLKLNTKDDRDSTKSDFDAGLVSIALSVLRGEELSGELDDWRCKQAALYTIIPDEND